MNGRISAILVTEGVTDIVRPGMMIDRGGSRVLVESIEPNAVILKTLDTRIPHTIRVNLAGELDAGPTPPPGPAENP